MNKENFLKVADAIEAENAAGVPLEFNMQTWGTPRDEDGYLVLNEYQTVCGTAACLAGTAAILSQEETRGRDKIDFEGRNSTTPWRAMEYLGLEKDRVNVIYDLFAAGNPDLLSFVQKRKDMVPDALRWMAHTGIVNWYKAFNAVECAREAGA